MKNKTLITTILAISSLLFSCSTSKQELKIITPVGVPSIAFYKHATSNNFETNSTPKNIVALMNANSEKDIVVIDTINGIQAVQKNNNFKIAATISFGNFFLVSTGNDENSTLDINDKIVLFGKGQTPDYIFHYIYGNGYDQNIEFVNAASDAAKCLILGSNPITQSKIDYVFLAQPAVYNAMQKNKNAIIYDNIQEKYKEKTGENLIQASIFVNNKSDKQQVDLLLNSLKEDIDELITTPSLIEEELKELPIESQSSIFGTNSEIIKTVLENNNGFGIGYKRAIDIKKEIDHFLGIFNINETTEDNYYK